MERFQMNNNGNATHPCIMMIDLVFLSRPVLFIPVWAFSIFGYWNAQGMPLHDLPRFWSSVPFSTCVWIFIFSCAVGSVYVSNQIADIDVDRNNGGLPLLAAGKVSMRSSVVMACTLGIIAIVIPLFYRHHAITALSLTALLIGAVYNFKPARLSGRPLFDFIANAAGFGIIAFGAGWHLGGGPLLSPILFIHALPWFSLMCAGSISSTLPDIEGDRRDGKITTAVRFGTRRAHALATAFIVLAAITALVNKDHAAFLCAAGAFPFYIMYSIRRSTALMEATYKAGGGFCMVAAGVLFPQFAAAAGVVFFSTWLYFRLRHQTAYPSLVPVKHV
jgi:4-hydroxybenzoate polyprenyltransferase